LFYFKKIISYFDYYEYGEKKRNCGFAKLLVKDSEVTLEIHIKGLGSNVCRMCDIYTAGAKRSRLGRFMVERGTGCYSACFRAQDCDGRGLRIFDVTGFYIPFERDTYCETQWEWGEIPAAEGNEEEAKRIKSLLKKGREGAAEEVDEQNGLFGPGHSTQEEPAREAEPKEIVDGREKPGVIGIEDERADETKDVPEATWVGELEEDPEEDSEEALPPDASMDINLNPVPADTEAKEEYKEEKPDRLMEEKMATEREEAEDGQLHKAQLGEGVYPGQRRTGAQGKRPIQGELHVDKWKQLCATYPVCHPFDNGEDYISIAPKDFIILRKEYQNLVGNSFLLHSFYNYHHVILGKAGDGGEDFYYIGVPGIYFERDKKVAVMFGFEGFAQSVKGNGNRVTNRRGMPTVETGAFGYYMRKVEI